MNSKDREYIKILLDEIKGVIEEVKDKAYRSDMEKQRELRERKLRFIDGRHVKREFNLLLKPLKEVISKLEITLEEDFNNKEIEDFLEIEKADEPEENEEE